MNRRFLTWALPGLAFLAFAARATPVEAGELLSFTILHTGCVRGEIEPCG